MNVTTHPPSNPPSSPSPKPNPPTGPGRTTFRVAFVSTVALAAALVGGPVAPMAGKVWSVVFGTAIGFVVYQFIRSHQKAGQ